MQSNRRNLLKMLAAGAASTAGFSAMPGMITAHGAEISGYKALVCVFLYGGLDSYDLLIPYDTPSYESLSSLRSSMLPLYGATRQRSALQPLTPSSDAVLGGRQLALPPELPQLKTLFDQGRAAFVTNVGPLVEPVTRTSFRSGTSRLPPRLFSHNDQQSVWQSNRPEGAIFGWGGLFADAVLASGANTAAPQFTTVTTGGAGPFLDGDRNRPFRINADGAIRLRELGVVIGDETPEQRTLARDIFNQLTGASYSGDHILTQDIAAAFQSGLTANQTYNEAAQSAQPLATTFQGRLGSQLQQVAQTIALRNQFGASRQIFFVGLGGFDTHSAQASQLPRLLTALDAGLVAFNTAMEELGVAQDVTLFTTSEFGRTLSVNGDGTDHGWGGHQIVMGGAVRGGDLYGAAPLPPTALGHEEDTGRGRMIPSMAVDQYAAELGRWFGLSDSDLSAALPYLNNFTPLARSFMN